VNGTDTPGEDVAAFAAALGQMDRLLKDLCIRVHRHEEVTKVSRDWTFFESGPHITATVVANLGGGHAIDWTLDAIRGRRPDGKPHWWVESSINLELGPGEYKADGETLREFELKKITSEQSLSSTLIEATRELTDSVTFEDLLEQAAPIRANYTPGR
jgi:hypothetical protein